MIMDECYEGTYNKGLKYYREHKVKELLLHEEDFYFQAVVEGSEDYHVRIYYDTDGDLRQTLCDCPAHFKYFGFCKHIVATLLAIQNRKDINTDPREIRAKQIAQNIFSYFADDNSYARKELILEPIYVLDFQESRFSQYTQSSLALNIGEEKTYVVKNMKRFLEDLSVQQEIEFGKKFTYNPYIHIFKPEDKAIIDLIREVYETHSLSSSYSYHNHEFTLLKGKEVHLPEILIKRLLNLLKNRDFTVRLNGVDYKNTRIFEEDLPICFHLSKEDENLIFQALINDKIIPLNNDLSYLFYQENVYHISENQRRNLFPFYQGLIKSQDNAILLTGEYKEKFVSELLPRVKKAGNLVIDQKLEEDIYQEHLKTEIYLDNESDVIYAEVKFIYGERNINPFAAQEKDEVKDKRILLRNIEKEREIITYFEDSQFKVHGTKMYLSEEDYIFDFIYQILPQLQQHAHIYYSDNFGNLKFNYSSGLSGRVELNQNLDLLEFTFDLEGIEQEEILDVVTAIQEKKKYHRLRDGSFLPIQSSELLSMAELVEGLDLKEADFKNGFVELPKFRALYVDQFFQDKQLTSVSRDKNFKQLARSIREPGETDFEIPEDMENVLRDYQKFGFKWLKTLAHYGFGGILADDMGLGKTLQAISFIKSERSVHSEPVLVIAPTSLIYNWKGEIEKFSPDLKTIVISGGKQERSNLLEESEGIDVIITSYPLIRRDIEEYEKIKFSYVILDEAQHIKNPHSLTAKAVKTISARNYFALTGTPIENSLTEMWSIFDFLMPGYFPSFAKFAQKYVKSIEKEGDPRVTKEISKKVKPFILRRVKKDVLKELPSKIEHKMVSELTKDQKKIYVNYLEQIKGEIAGEIKNQGFEKSRMKILAGLTRLRQICCHPGLFVENYSGDSGKLIQLQEILEDIRESGHRTLIFSQFTSMLNMIRETLEKNKFTYFYLDGSVKSQDRMEMVEAFNKGEGDVFLISLKAGGTGLNLTGADTVIHFDPWWNPAVEEQASDRAHRIGQKKVVQVMKLIAMGTIEEKIYELQQKKKELIDKVITAEETMITSMSEDEIKDLLEI